MKHRNSIKIILAGMSLLRRINCKYFENKLDYHDAIFSNKHNASIKGFHI